MTPLVDMELTLSILMYSDLERTENGRPIYTTEYRAQIERMYLEENMSFLEIAKVVGSTRSTIGGLVDRMKLKRSAAATAASNSKRSRSAAATRLAGKPPKQPKAWTERETGWQVAKRRRQVKAQKAQPVKVVTVRPPLPRPVVIGIVTPPVHLLDLTSSTCRWPIGDVHEHMYCGAPVQSKVRPPMVYCAQHNGIAYQEPRSR